MTRRACTLFICQDPDYCVLVVTFTIFVNISSMFFFLFLLIFRKSNFRKSCYFLPHVVLLLNNLLTSFVPKMNLDFFRNKKGTLSHKFGLNMQGKNAEIVQNSEICKTKIATFENLQNKISKFKNLQKKIVQFGNVQNKNCKILKFGKKMQNPKICKKNAKFGNFGKNAKSGNLQKKTKFRNLQKMQNSEICKKNCKIRKFAKKEKNFKHKK